jgi:hypothetical protein
MTEKSIRTAIVISLICSLSSCGIAKPINVGWGYKKVWQQTTIQDRIGKKVVQESLRKCTKVTVEIGVPKLLIDK